ncbi:MAG: phage holin family protein [Schleiferiaceae bacterium]|jgi:hypothetical protein|nr:phage holin family protein [Schleiferiaceae bacterium]
MNDYTSVLKALLERIEGYSIATAEWFKLTGVAKAADYFSSFASNVIWIGVLVFSFVFLSFGLALWLGQELGQSYWGFLIVGLLYALIATILAIFFRRRIKRKTSDALIRILLRQ